MGTPDSGTDMHSSLRGTRDRSEHKPRIQKRALEARRGALCL